MPLLAAYDLHVQFQSKVLFDGTSLGVEVGDRLGLVGANGSGKSTLLKILTGQVEPERGKVVRARGVRIGYLAQEIANSSAGSLIDAVMAAAPKKSALIERRDALLEEIDAAAAEDGVRAHELAQALADLEHEIAEVERRFARHRAERVLAGLGFTPEDSIAPLSAFSGGWRMRAALASLLFQEPDVLLLDEPTNHLDLPSVRWLDRFLDAFPHALVLVCHDRQFLNRHINRVAAFEPEGLKTFRGNYDGYVTQRAIDLEVMEARANRDEKKRQQLQVFVDRFKAKASKARQAQSKAKLIEKLEAEMPDMPPPRRSVRIVFPKASRCSDPAVEAIGVGHAYDGNPVFGGVDLSIRPGERIAIVGRNGAGKTTLLKILAGELLPAAGSVKRGHNVELRYFAQHHADQLQPSSTVYNEVQRAAPKRLPAEIRGICGSFLFSGDEIEKPISVLSGGEKTRVALARLLVEPGNVLLLDEPTNHLDTEAAERLTESLEAFDGAIVFVSHNLDFARRLANRVFVVENHRVRHFPGTLEDWLASFDEQADVKTTRQSAAPTEKEEDKAERIRLREEQRQKEKERGKREKRVAQLEQVIAQLETKAKTLEDALAAPGAWEDRAGADAKARELAQTRKDLEARIAEWETASGEA